MRERMRKQGERGASAEGALLLDRCPARIAEPQSDLMLNENVSWRLRQVGARAAQVAGQGRICVVAVRLRFASRPGRIREPARAAIR